ncbi:MAG: D-alanyl-D-alanine carboxypeptidase [Clostridiales bacterium]|nr:D-alanyl-D-alanine carboxypeptidase [Clostridiales bacterium]
MKRKFSVIFILVAFVLTIGTLLGFTKPNAFAESIDNIGIEFKSKSVYLMDKDSKSVIFEKNSEDKKPIASMCKIMTLLLCFEELDSGNISLNDNIFVSEVASGMGGSQIFLESGASYQVSELIKGIVVASANDACVAMAEKICGSESAFVNKMNEKAMELGMNNTNFVNCTGLPKAGQYSTAKDVAIMFSELLEHKDYYQFSRIWMDTIKHPKDRVTEISNTNKLIKFYEGCDGGKTGYTSEAGHCLCASAIRNGLRFISVVISAPDSKTRFKEVSEMFNYGFANYNNKILVDNKNPLEIPVEIKGGKKENVSVLAEKPLYLFSKKGEERNVEIDFKPNQNVKAPVLKGDILGKLTVYENGVEIASVNAVASETILKATYLDQIKNVIINWKII